MYDNYVKAKENVQIIAASRIRTCAGNPHWISSPTPLPLGHRSHVVLCNMETSDVDPNVRICTLSFQSAKNISFNEFSCVTKDPSIYLLRVSGCQFVCGVQFG